jgi:hypothetical protein
LAAMKQAIPRDPVNAVNMMRPPLRQNMGRRAMWSQTEKCNTVILPTLLVAAARRRVASFAPCQCPAMPKS